MGAAGRGAEADNDRGFYPSFQGRGKVKNLPVSVTAFLLAILVAGCGTLPDGKPFSDVTGTWSASVKTKG
jgi:hypothetical protein